MQPICAVILAAGQSARLRPLTNHKPKCLLPMGPKTILDWQLQSLIAVGVTNIILVVGYRKESIEDHIATHYPNLSVTYVTNSNFATTNTLFSLSLALQQYQGDFYYLNADVVFDDAILRRLAKLQNGGFLAVDRKQCREEEVKVLVQDQQVLQIGKHLDPKLCYGEFIGVAKFAGEFAGRFRKAVLAHAVSGNEMRFFEHALDVMPHKTGLTAVDITGLPCVEVDFPEDYEYAVQQVLTTFAGIKEQR
ncbi:phosphocholine cytidylyltransferase family protein [Alicyclobacillaceae bacterium I2511]|nr:phosphocholine cytidylyltransferase family protein [Alicyclobacillaceae bacterium I2511]